MDELALCYQEEYDIPQLFAIGICGECSLHSQVEMTGQFLGRFGASKRSKYESKKNYEQGPQESVEDRNFLPEGEYRF